MNQGATRGRIAVTITDHRSHGGRRKCRARNLARRRRRTSLGDVFGRGASGGARNIDPKSVGLSPPSYEAAEPDKKRDVTSLPLPHFVQGLDFCDGRATAMKRDTRLGIVASATLRMKRDTILPVVGTRRAICCNSRLGSDCRKREPVSVRDRGLPGPALYLALVPQARGPHTPAPKPGRGRRRQGGGTGRSFE